MKQKYLRQFEEYLRANSLKLTGQRRAIAEAFFQEKDHVWAEELYRHIQKTMPDIGLTTVYRTLKLLVAAGLASGKNFGDGFARYECCRAKADHHDHLICTQCGKIIEFVNPYIEKLQETVARQHDFKLSDHTLDMYGLCGDCQ